MAEAFRRFFCPAKINLFLDVLGRRRDRYHDILSLVCQVDFGDHLLLTLQPEGIGPDFLSCDVPLVPCDFRNTVYRALALFRQVYDFPGRVTVQIEKNIPLQSGFGGGSSDGALFLWHLNELLGRPLDHERLCQIALAVGSDMPLFLHGSPAIVRGRGQRVEDVPLDKVQNLKDLRLILFKPAFAVSTARAYGSFRFDPMPEEVRRTHGEARLGQLLDSMARPGGSLSGYFNMFQSGLSEKFLELALILRDLLSEFGVQAYLTGTGSGCYIPLAISARTDEIMAYLRSTLGPQSFVVETRPLLRPALGLP